MPCVKVLGWIWPVLECTFNSCIYIHLHHNIS